jgi:glycosyltransferase involved in cell wall biosynthesis
LVAQARRLGLGEAVRFVGWVSQKELAERMVGADVFVLPSLHECGGAVVLEAMACGKPTIAVNWGGPGDYLDGETGVLVEAGPREKLVEDLAEAMVGLANDAERRRALGRAARGKVEREYSWRGKIEVMMGVYRRVAGGEGRTSNVQRSTLNVQ